MLNLWITYIYYGVDILNKLEHTVETFDEIEINILYHKKIITTFILDASEKTFKFEETTYNININKAFFYPTDKDFLPALFYKKNSSDPLVFKNKNDGIPARALHLLWNHRLYKVLVSLDKDRTNLIIIILLLASIFLYGLRMYAA